MTGKRAVRVKTTLRYISGIQRLVSRQACCSMQGAGFLLILAALWAAPALCRTNPDDIEFKIKFVADKSFFNAGEPIEIEISCLSQSQNKYQGSWTSPSPELETVIPTLTPTDGVFDLRAVQDFLGFGGSFVSSIGFPGTEPVVQRLDLGDWY